jgi:hypothetical protein
VRYVTTAVKLLSCSGKMEVIPRFSANPNLFHH